MLLGGNSPFRRGSLNLTGVEADFSPAMKLGCDMPKFRDKIASADFLGKFLSQKSGAKVRLARLTFATD